MTRATVLLGCLLLGACGQRGGLYIPEESRPTAVPATPAAGQLPADATGTANAPAGDTDASEEQRRRQQQAAPPSNATGN